MDAETVTSMYGGTITVGSLVERLDNYKRGGRVLAINLQRPGQPVFVRWPIMDDEWYSPRDLMLKSEKEES